MRADRTTGLRLPAATFDGYKPRLFNTTPAGTAHLPAFALKTAAARTITPWPICLGTRLVNVHRAAIQIRAVDGGNCLFTFAIVWHLHEAKATSLTGVPIRHNVYTIDCTVDFEQCTDRRFRSPKTEVSNENIFHSLLFLLRLEDDYFGRWTKVAGQ